MADSALPAVPPAARGLAGASNYQWYLIRVDIHRLKVKVRVLLLIESCLEQHGLVLVAERTGSDGSLA